MLEVEPIKMGQPVPERMKNIQSFLTPENNFVIEEEIILDNKLTKVKLVSPIPYPKTEEENLLRIKVFNIPPSEICSLDDLRQFLNGAISRLLDLDMYYRYPPGTAVPSMGQKITPPPGSLEAPVKSIGNLNIFNHTCVVDVAFPLAGVGLRCLQGLPCYGRPLVFQRVKFDAEKAKQQAEEKKNEKNNSEECVSVKKDPVTILIKAEEDTKFTTDDDNEIPDVLTHSSSDAGMLWISGINPYSTKEHIKSVIENKMAELKTLIERSKHHQFKMELESCYLPTNRVTDRIIGIAIVKLNVVALDQVSTENISELQQQIEDYKESAFLVSSVRGLSRLLNEKIVDRYKWCSIPFLDYQAHSIDAFRSRARNQVINPSTNPLERIFEINREPEELYPIDITRSMTSRVFGDNLVEGLLVQRSRTLGMRPSRILQLNGIVFAEDLLSESTIIDLAKCIYSEFKKHAKIVQIVIPVPSLTEPLLDETGEENENAIIATPPGTGKVFVEVIELYGARKLQNMMNGVSFDLIRTCAVGFFPEQLFMNLQLTTADEFYEVLNNELGEMPGKNSSSENLKGPSVRCFIPAKKGKLKEVKWGTAGVHKVAGTEEQSIDDGVAEGDDAKDEDEKEASLDSKTKTADEQQS